MRLIFIEQTRKTFSGQLFKDVDHIVNEDGQYIFYKCWRPDGQVK